MRRADDQHVVRWQGAISSLVYKRNSTLFVYSGNLSYFHRFVSQEALSDRATYPHAVFYITAGPPAGPVNELERSSLVEAFIFSVFALTSVRTGIPWKLKVL